jgi:hypothetical protein
VNLAEEVFLIFIHFNNGGFMSKTDEEHEALIETVYKNGETLAVFGDYDEDAGEGHDVELIGDDGSFLVVERNNDEEIFNLYDDEPEAREAFAELKAQIEKEDAEE